MWLKDNNLSTVNHPKYSELIQSAIVCSEESIESSVNTTPEATPNTTPSSTPPSRRKRKQRQSVRTKSPSKEKMNTISLPVGGGASSAATATKNKLLSPEEEKLSDLQPIQVICVPLTSNWNVEVVYMAEQESEAEVSCCMNLAFFQGVHFWAFLVVSKEFRGREHCKKRSAITA